MKAARMAVFSLIWCCGLIAWRQEAAAAPPSVASFSQDPGLVALRITLEPVVASGLLNPLYVTNAHDGSGRLFIVEQAGRIRVLQPGSTAPAVFLDIRSKILAGGERGLLGLAFHPRFPSDRRFFLNYTRTGDGATVVSEYRVSASDPNVADPAETIILVIPQPYANHNGGMIEFGPDRLLYIGMGDGGSGNDPENRAQNLNDLLGKMLRIDIDRPESPSVLYTSPSSNPFFGPIEGRDEIYATGLRNPWRFSFDRATGQLYAGDVGQNIVEEVDIITLGGNYGWRVFEGTRCNIAPCNAGSFISPITEYAHTPGSQGRCSVTGGYVYRGTRQSLPLGAYVYADYCSGEIFVLSGGAPSVLLDTNLSISSFGEDESGEIYVVAMEGSVFRIVNPDAPAVPTLYFPDLVTTNDSTGEYTGIAVANLSAATDTLTFTAYDRTGRPITGPNITNPASVGLASGEQSALTDSRLFGPGLAASNSVGWVKLESRSRQIAASFLTYDRSLTVLDGADASLSPLNGFVLPELEEQGITRLHVVNPNAESTAITFELVGTDGSPLASAERNINGSGALVESASDLFPGAGLIGSSYIRAVSDRAIVPFEHLSRPGRYAQAVNGFDSTSGSARLYSPQYVVGGSWRSTLSIVNLDSSPGTVTFRFIGDDGTPIGSPRQMPISRRGKLYITDQQFFMGEGGTSQGYVEIVASGVRIIGTVVFGDPERNLFSAALPLVNASQKQLVFSQIASDATYFTGIAIVNPRDSDVSANIEVFDSNGKLLASTIEVVNRRGRTCRLLTEFFPNLTGMAVSSGYVTITAEGEVGGFALYGTHSLSVLSAINAQPRPR
jgi:glucose/arabinose dehydrogenase